jgi:type II secretory pathway predicted ATPase ExeA
MIDLKTLLAKHDVKLTPLSRACDVSERAMRRFVATGELPKNFNSMQRDVLCKSLIAYGLQRKDAANIAGCNLPLSHSKPITKKTAASTGQAAVLNQINAPNPTTDQGVNQIKDKQMLPRKSVLSRATRTHFNLTIDPLGGELTSIQDVYLSPDMREMVEAMLSCARNGGAMAVVGESGSGKTTLKQLLIEKLNAADSKVTVVEPYVQAMEDNDMVGKTLKSLAIAYSIIKAIDPLAKPKRDAQARFEQLHMLLKNNASGGNHTVLVIEEAHALPIPTLKHLKRFLELRAGFKPLISIVLIGQPELAMRLNPKNIDTREVSQRFDVVSMTPLNAYVADFLKHKFKRANTILDAVFDKGAVDALISRLGGDTGEGKKSKGANNLYPLAICNLASAAMNAAAETKMPKVNAEIMLEVGV